MEKDRKVVKFMGEWNDYRLKVIVDWIIWVLKVKEFWVMFFGMDIVRNLGWKRF